MDAPDLRPPSLVPRRVPSGGVELHVVSSPVEPAGRETVVFLHGYPDSHRTWSHQLAALAPSFRVAAFDLRGTGASGRPRGRRAFATGPLCRDVGAVLDALVGPEGEAHLVGHDWGALIGWRLVSHPEHARRVRSFTAIAGPHPDLALRLQLRRLRRLDPRGWLAAARQLRASWYIGLFQLPLLPELVWRAAPRAVWRAVHRAGGVAAGDPLLDAGAAEAVACGAGPLDLYRELARSWLRPGPPPRIDDVPVCLVIPARDVAITPEVYEATADHVRSLETHVLDAGHWVHRERPDEVNALIRDFVGRHAGPRGAG